MTTPFTTRKIYTNDECFCTFFEKDEQEMLHKRDSVSPRRCNSPNNGTGALSLPNNFALRRRANEDADKVRITIEGDEDGLIEETPIVSPSVIRQTHYRETQARSVFRTKSEERRYKLHLSNNGTSYKYKCSTCGLLGRNKRTCMHLPNGQDEQEATASPSSLTDSPMTFGHKRVYRCSICKREGHKSNTCPGRP
jgi:hypothetical protein